MQNPVALGNTYLLMKSKSKRKNGFCFADRMQKVEAEASLVKENYLCFSLPPPPKLKLLFPVLVSYFIVSV